MNELFNLVKPNQTQPQMTSLEIAELLGCRHDNLRVSIERLSEQGAIQLPVMQEVKQIQSLSPNNKTRAYIFVGEQGRLDAITVVAQNCPKFTAAIVKRWDELEKQFNQFKIPQTLSEALFTAAELARENGRQTLIIQQQATQIQEKTRPLFPLRVMWFIIVWSINST